jgi:hypothetical protein
VTAGWEKVFLSRRFFFEKDVRPLAKKEQTLHHLTSHMPPSIKPPVTLLQHCLVLAVLLMAFLAAPRACGQFYNGGALGTSYLNPTGTNSNEAPYNLEWGPIDYNFNASLTGAYNDNINYASTHTQSDFIITTAAGVNARWITSDDNTLTFNLGIGYNSYVEHPQDDSVYIDPNSKISYNFRLGDYFSINVHEALSYQQNPALIPQVSNVSNFPVAINDAGISLSWGGSDIFTPQITYDHINQFAFTSQYSYIDYNEDIIGPSISFHLAPHLTTGIGATAAWTRYDQTRQNDSTSISIGPFVQWHPDDNLSGSASVGYSESQYATGGQDGDNSNSNKSFYGSLGVSYQIDPYWNASLVGGEDYIPGLTSNYTRQTYGGITATWNPGSNFNMSGRIYAANYQDSGATISEDSNNYTAGVTASYSLSSHATLSASYYRTIKDSDMRQQNYTQDLISVGINYQF